MRRIAKGGGLTDLAKHHAVGRVLDEFQGDEIHSCELGGDSLVGESTLEYMAVTTFNVVYSIWSEISVSWLAFR